jgi:hypothetical protein
MDVISQLHASASANWNKERPLSVEKNDVWATEPVCALQSMMREAASKRTFLASVGYRTVISWLFGHCTDYDTPAAIINITYIITRWKMYAGLRNVLKLFNNTSD